MQHHRPLLAIAFALAASTALAAAPDLPDSSRTPGATNADVTQDNIRENICRSGYTASIRPNTSVTNALKRQQLRDWGYADRRMADYEEDHLISLQLGGSQDSPENLWPEHYSGTWGARIKDTLEGELKRRICTRATDPDHITLQEGRDAISHDWKAAYARYVCTRSRPALTAIIRRHCS